MELEEGMYIKVLGQIRQIKQIENNSLTNVDLISLDKCIDYWGNYDDFIDKNTFIKFKGKASHKPIDLIEVGDYVNGHKVSKVVIDTLSSYVLLEEVGSYVENPEDIDEEDIKSIVTKEEFESMSYEVCHTK